MASLSTALVHKSARSSESQSAQTIPRDVLLPTSKDGTVTRRGELGLSIRQFAQAGGKVMESVLSPLVNLFWGPDRCRSEIKKFFGEDDHDKRLRQAALDELHTVLQNTSRDSLSRQQKTLRKACHELLECAKESQTIDTQLLTFKILVTTITRYPGLRRLLCDHKNVRNKSEKDFHGLWMRQERQAESCGEEWNFYRKFALFGITENALTKLVEAAKPSELALVKLEEGNLNNVPIEELLGWCKFTGPDFNPPRLCAIRYTGGILALPSFWDKGGPEEVRFFVVLSDVCGTMFELLRDTEAKAADISVDTSPSMSAARDAVDILCTVTFKGLLRLRTTDRLPRDFPVRLPDVISLLGGDEMKAMFPISSAIAPAVRALFVQSPTPHASPGNGNESHKHMPQWYREAAPTHSLGGNGGLGAGPRLLTLPISDTLGRKIEIPSMSLVEFCEDYKLGGDIFGILNEAELDVDGLIEANDLASKEIGLKFGHVAEVKWALKAMLLKCPAIEQVPISGGFCGEFQRIQSGRGGDGGAAAEVGGKGGMGFKPLAVIGPATRTFPSRDSSSL